MTSAETLKTFKQEQSEALLSLDADKIRRFYRKWNGQEMPANPLVFWGSIHKAITGHMGFPIEFRNQSKAWLDEHGFKSLDDGELTGNSERKYDNE